MAAATPTIAAFAIEDLEQIAILWRPLLEVPLAVALSWLAAVAALIGLVVSVVATVRSHGPAIRAWLAAHPVEVALGALALGVRWAMPPYFVHSNLHGPEILHEMASVPYLGVIRAYFGQSSFVVNGFLVGWWPDPWLSTRLLNGVFSTLGLVGAAAAASLLAPAPQAVLARRAALSLGVLHPLIVRVAASEDAHNLGFGMGMAAVALALVARRRPDTPHVLWMLACTTALATHARHAFLAWPALILSLLLAPPRVERTVPTDWKRPALAAAVLLLPGYLEGVAQDNEVTTYVLATHLVALVTDPTFLSRHPLLRPSMSAVLTPMALVGVAVALRRRTWTALLVTGGAAALSFVAVIFSFHPHPNEEYAFRLPEAGLWLPLAGLGLAAVVHALAPTARGIAARAAVGVALLAPLPGLVAVWRIPDPIATEYAVLRAHASTLPPDAAVWWPAWSMPEAAPGWTLPPEAFRGTTVEVLTAGREAYDPEQHRLFVVEGLWCTTYSFGEAFPDGNDGLWHAMMSADRATLAQMSRDVWDDPVQAFRAQGFEPPRTRRPQCEALDHVATTHLHWDDVPTDEAYLPHFWPIGPSAPVGAWEVPASVDLDALLPPRQGKGDRDRD